MTRLNEAQAVKARRRRATAAAVPILLVNAVAFSGQLAFLRAHLPWPLAGQVVMAAALESIAVFLAMHAHVAMLADDSALRLRLASYGFGAIIGGMNYSHYAGPGLRPAFPAVAVGLMSASSPWLWAVHSRRASRNQLRAAGLIEPHALRLGATRWMWHPLRSARVMFAATWTGVTDPREAIASCQARQAKGASRPSTTPTSEHGAASRQHRARGGTSRMGRPGASRRAVAGPDIEAQALAVLARQPQISGAGLGRELGASPRTGQRLLSRLAGQASVNGSQP